MIPDKLNFEQKYFDSNDLCRVDRKDYKLVLTTDFRNYVEKYHAFIALWSNDIESSSRRFPIFLDQSQKDFVKAFPQEANVKEDTAACWDRGYFIKVRIYISEFNIATECWIKQEQISRSSILFNISIRDKMKDMIEYMLKENDTCVLDDLDESIKWIRYYYE